MRGARTGAVALLSAAYLAYVFRLADPVSRSAGLGDWIDPYLINTLLEHWFRALGRMADPASPPMFFPVRHTLGYSDGLVLYAFPYAIARWLLPPFQAYTAALFATIAGGTLGLYAALRRLRLSFVEAAILTFAFLTSRNALDDLAGVWSQRASVFLIPPLMLLALWSRRSSGRVRCATGAALCGLGVGAMFVQDFYTAQFALLFGVIAIAAMVFVEGHPIAWARSEFRTSPRAVVATVPGVVIACAELAVQAAGGVVRIAGLRVASHGMARPVAALAVSAAAFLALGGGRGELRRIKEVCATDWTRWFGGGLAVSAAGFLWTYLPSFRAHSTFPDREVIEQLTVHVPFNSAAPLALLFGLMLIAAYPRAADARTRRYTVWALGGGLLAMCLPMRIGGFSVWMTFFHALPGFTVIRDPKRVAYVFQLATVLFAAFFLTRLPGPSAARRIALALIVAAGIFGYSGERFDYARPDREFDRWVRAPIAVDPACASFYVVRATPEYEARSPNVAAMYGLDALSIALETGVPTLNGYSAWAPAGWSLADPGAAGYASAVRAWTARGLRDVCALDLVQRRMALP